MKVKDLMSFNPEAELTLMGMDFYPIRLEVYGWSSPCDTNDDTKMVTDEIHLIPKGLEDKFNELTAGEA